MKCAGRTYKYGKNVKRMKRPINHVIMKFGKFSNIIIDCKRPFQQMAFMLVFRPIHMMPLNAHCILYYGPYSIIMLMLLLYWKLLVLHYNFSQTENHIHSTFHYMRNK